VVPIPVVVVVVVTLEREEAQNLEINDSRISFGSFLPLL
jgi:hypothetical protein